MGRRDQFLTMLRVPSGETSILRRRDGEKDEEEEKGEGAEKTEKDAAGSILVLNWALRVCIIVSLWACRRFFLFLSKM
jgi:hypothetical protein